MYEVKFSPSVRHDLAKLALRISESDFQNIEIAVLQLKEMPRPPGVRKIRGRENSYRVRVGKYRIVYEIQDKIQTVTIIEVIRRTDTTYNF
ncbi:MAG: type II toxin-antitoxin system RelE/ParE family toxin [Chloroflexota bacterium]